MAFAALPAKIATSTLDLADYNKIKDNFTASPLGVYTSLGDLFVGTGANAAVRLAVGSDGDILLADSGEASGLLWQTLFGARVYDSGGFSLGAASWTTVTFDSERYDNGGCHSTVSNTGRLTVPTGGGGIYIMGGAIELETSAGAGEHDVGLRVRLNGSDIVVSAHNEENVNFDIGFGVVTVYALAAADYIELQAYDEDGDDINTVGNWSPEFWFQWLRT